MSESRTSGSFPVSQVVAYHLTERFEKLAGVERKLIAVTYAMDALWYLSQSKSKKSVKFPAIIKGMGQSPVRYLVGRATSGQDTPEQTAVQARGLFEEFVSLNQESIGFGGELKVAIRESQKARLPLALLLEVERLARPDKVMAEDARQLAEVMGVILNSGKGAIDDLAHRPGAGVSVLISKLCPLQTGNGVLDMSCGTGTLLSELLGDNSNIRAFGQETDQELAVISWLRMELHPAASSAQVVVGDPLRYAYASTYNPVDVAVVHSIDFDSDEEGKAAILQSLREAEEAEQRISVQRGELEHRCEILQKTRNEAKWALEAFLEEFEGMPPAEAGPKRKELESRLQALEREMRDREHELMTLRVTAFELSRARKSAHERAKKPARDRTYELIKHGLDCVGPAGLTIGVVSARALFKSPQVDQLRSEALEHNRLDLVVELPRGVDGAEDRVAILVFRKGRKDEPVLFVDATDHEAIRKVARSGSAFEPVAGYRRSRFTVLTPEFFSAIAQVCVDRSEIPGVSALVPRSALGGVSLGGRMVDLRPRQFLAVDRLEEESAGTQSRIVACHQAVAEAEDALAKARAKLGLPPLFIPTSSSKSPRQPGN
jgi:SAM-dependent methyltransferase